MITLRRADSGSRPRLISCCTNRVDARSSCATSATLNSARSLISEAISRSSNAPRSCGGSRSKTLDPFDARHERR